MTQALYGLAAGVGNTFLNGVSSWFGSNLSRRQQERLMQKQFEYNKYFAENSHQMEVADLRKAGLNPILSANAGATGSVGLGSATDLGMSDTGTKSFSTAMQMAMLRSQKNNLEANTAKARQEAETSQSQSSLFKQQAIQSSTAAQVNTSQSQLNNIMAQQKIIENSYLPNKLKSEILLNLNTAKAQLINANANMAGSTAQQINARANMINATYGNPWKTGVETAKNVVDNMPDGRLKRIVKRYIK